MNFNNLLEILNEMFDSEGDSGNYTLNWGNGEPGVIVSFKPGTKILHNENGPAVELHYKSGKPKLIQYYREGKLHNLNGPAIQEFDDFGAVVEKKYYLKGKEVLPNEVSQLSKNYTESDIDIMDDLNS